MISEEKHNKANVVKKLNQLLLVQKKSYLLLYKVYTVNSSLLYWACYDLTPAS